MKHFTYNTIFGENENCFLMLDRYKNTKGLAILIADEQGIITKATLNVGLSLNVDEVVIKTYTENEGLLDQLYELGFVTEVLYWIQVGYTKAPVVKLDLNLIKEFSKDYEIAQ